MEDRIHDSTDLPKQQCRVAVLVYVREFNLDVAHMFVLMARMADTWITFYTGLFL